MDPNVMTCQESSGNLLARFRQELSSADSQKTEEHLSVCATCREEEAGVESLDRLLSSLPKVEPSADSWSSMLMLIEAEEPSTPVRRGRGRLIALVAALAAACLLLIIFLPSSSSPTLLAGPGEITLNGAPVSPDHPIELGDSAVISADTMALAAFALSRSISVVMARGSRLKLLEDGSLRLLAGQIHVEVAPGDQPIRFYAVGDTYAEVTGTAFVLTRNGPDTTATVAVAEGEVEVFTGASPVVVQKGQSLVFGPKADLTAPTPVDPARITDWCSAPTALLRPDGDLLRLTLRNDTVRNIRINPFDPQKAIYSLLIEGPEIRLPVKIQERMVTRSGGTDEEIRTLSPGEGYDLLLDSNALGLERGTYRLRAVYKPYPPLPTDVWHGPPLTTEALTLNVE